MFPLHPLLQRSRVDRQLFVSACQLRRRSRWRVRGDQRSASLTHSAGRLQTLDDMDLDGRPSFMRRILVRIEVGLLDTAVLDCDLTIERRRDAEDDRALDLRPDGVGLMTVPQSTAQTTRRTRTVPSSATSTSADLRHIGPEHELDGDAATGSFRQWLPQPALIRGKIEHSLARGALSRRARR